MSNVAIVINSRMLQAIEKVFSEDEDFKVLDKRDIGESTSLLDVSLHEDIRAVIQAGGYTHNQRVFLHERIAKIAADVQRDYSFEDYNDFIGATLERYLDTSN